MLSKKGFTVIELLTAIGVIAILAAILVPTLAGVRARAEVSKSFSNLRQIYAASQMYANEHKGRVPPAYVQEYGTHWMQLIGPYLSGEKSRADGGEKKAGYLASEVLVAPRWEDSPNYRPDAYWLWGYGMNTRLQRPNNNLNNRLLDGRYDQVVTFHQIPFPATTVLIGESTNWHFEPDVMDLERWDGESHVLYADGRVESALPEKVERLVADPSDT